MPFFCRTTILPPLRINTGSKHRSPYSKTNTEYTRDHTRPHPPNTYEISTTTAYSTTRHPLHPRCSPASHNLCSTVVVSALASRTDGTRARSATPPCQHSTLSKKKLAVLFKNTSCPCSNPPPTPPPCASSNLNGERR